MSQLGYAKYRFQPRPACFGRKKIRSTVGGIAWVPVVITKLASTATSLAGHEGPEQPRPPSRGSAMRVGAAAQSRLSVFAASPGASGCISLVFELLFGLRGFCCSLSFLLGSWVRRRMSRKVTAYIGKPRRLTSVFTMWEKTQNELSMNCVGSMGSARWSLGAAHWGVGVYVWCCRHKAPSRGANVQAPVHLD
jgi:hypothetical protein